MSDTEQREMAETLFPRQTREEIKGAIKLEEERRAGLGQKPVPFKSPSSVARPR